MDKYGVAALEALNFIEAQRAPGAAVWRGHDHPKAKPAHSLYHGAGGVILLLLELYAGAGEAPLLEKAVAAGDDILAYLGEGPELSVNSSTGWAGYAFALAELAKASGQARFRDGAVRCLEQVERAIDVFERKIQLLERGGWFADLRKKRRALDRLLPTIRATPR